MVKLYVNLIKNKMKTIDDVPARWKADVAAELERQGIV